MKDDEIRSIVAEHWRASAAGDLQAEHDIYADDVVCTIRNPMSESMVAQTCRRCGATTRPSLQALT